MTQFFRCPVTSDRSDASVVFGCRRHAIEVQEASIDGFTVLVPRRLANRLRLGKTWKLLYDGSTLEVHPQWLYQAPGGDFQVGLLCMNDLTIPGGPGRVRRSSFGRPGLAGDVASPILLAAPLLGILAVLSLPGVSQSLGLSNVAQFCRSVAGDWFGR